MIIKLEEHRLTFAFFANVNDSIVTIISYPFFEKYTNFAFESLFESFLSRYSKYLFFSMKCLKIIVL